MNFHHQPLIITELTRLESLNFMGLLGIKYLTEALTTPDNRGNRVRAVNINPDNGWAIAAFGKPGEEKKHKFVKDIGGRWHYDGVEKIEMVH